MAIHFFNGFELGSQNKQKWFLIMALRRKTWKDVSIVFLWWIWWHGFFSPFVVEFSNCVQKGKKTQERKIERCFALSTTLCKSNLIIPPKKSLDLVAQVWGLLFPLQLWLKVLCMIVLEVGAFLSSYFHFGAKSSHMWKFGYDLLQIEWLFWKKNWPKLAKIQKNKNKNQWISIDASSR